MQRSKEFDDVLVYCTEIMKLWHFKCYHRQINEDSLQEALKKALEDEYKYTIDTKHVLNFLILKYRLAEQIKNNYYKRHPIDDRMKEKCYLDNNCKCDLKAISKMINGLSMSKRKIIYLTAKGYKINEIAELTNRTAKWVKSQLYMIRKQLAQALL